jgi:hypothetical protein
MTLEDCCGANFFWNIAGALKQEWQWIRLGGLGDIRGIAGFLPFGIPASHWQGYFLRCD